MSHPDVVQSALGDESVAARVDLGDDALFVTPTKTLVYRADSLLSDESVGEFPHGAERISVSAGRRKATITLDYGLDGERSFTVPSKRLDSALHPVLAGTLNATGVTDAGETVTETFRFSELTLVVTSDRLVKHIGNAVWDEEFEEYHYDDVTDLTFEQGSLATLRERFAVEDEEHQSPSATMSFGEGPTPLSANPGELAEKPKNATRVDDPGDAESTTSVDTLAAAEPTADADAAGASTADDDDQGEATTTHGDTGTETAHRSVSAAEASTGGTEPQPSTVDRVDTETTDRLLGGGAGTTSGGDSESAGGAAEVDGDRDADLATLAAEVEALRESVDAQNERIARQEELIERLIAELRNRL